ncbi:MAG: 4Fe-4S binding protein [Pseudomonadota bacterium]
MAQQRVKEHRINRDWCKGCGICVHFCPRRVLELDSMEKAVAARPQECICCRLCELRCPDLAIEVITDAMDTPAVESDSTRSAPSDGAGEAAPASRQEFCHE